MSKTKQCTTCGGEFPATDEYFSKVKSSKDGFRNQCKRCVSNQKKQYYEKNKENRIKMVKIWSSNNKEKVKENHQKYQKNNRKAISAKQKEWANKEENRDRVRSYQREYSKKWREDNKEHLEKYMENNKEKRAEKRKIYIENNRDLFRVATQRRNALKTNLPATLTALEWEFIKESFGFTCCYCGEELPLAQEHYVSVANLGGYELGNILPACQSCNSSKGAKHFDDWYPTHGSYAPERESKILEFIEKTKEMNISNSSNVA